MKLNKYNYEKHKYEEIEFEDNKYNFKTYSNDMDEIVNCPQCLKEIKFGEAYTSQEYQTLPFGFGYAVCEKCHNEELERRKKWYIKK